MPSGAKPLTQMVLLLRAALQDRLDRQTVDKHFDEIDHDCSNLSYQAKKVVRKAWEDLLHYIEDGPHYRRRQREQLSKRMRQLMELLWEEGSELKARNLRVCLETIC
jgi:hypothetical protein